MQSMTNKATTIYYSKHYYSPLLWVVILLFWVSGCANETSPLPSNLITIDEPVPTPTVNSTGRGAGGALRILYWDAPTILNPHLSSAQKDHQIVRIFYEPLASFDQEGNLVPILAQEIPSLENGDVAADGKSVTWRLKQGVQWSDGNPFTAEDVRFTYEFITNPDVGSNTILSYRLIDNIEVIDDYTIKIHFIDVNPAWSLPFVGVFGIILPEHIFKDYNGSNAREAPANIKPIGTGPYQVMDPGIKPQEVLFLGSKLVQTNKIMLEPNPYFREEDKPYFSHIELRGGGTAQEAGRLLQQGDIDYAWNLTLAPDELAQLEAEGVGQLVTNFGSTVDQIELNFTDPNRETEAGERSSIEFAHPAFNDLKVRQAFAHAIDIDTILALYGLTGQKTAHILVSPPQFKSDKIFYTFDLQKAAELLDEAGWIDNDKDGIRDKNGVKLKALFQTYENPIRQATQRIIQQDMRSIGIDVELKITPITIFYGGGMNNPDHNGRFIADMQESDWTAISPEPTLFLQYWTCGQIPQLTNNWSGFNFRRWCNSEYDALYEEAKAELDPDKRQQIIIKMNDLISADVASIPIVRLARVSGINQDLQGFAPTPWDAETWNIKDWRRSQ